jgi:hypothetical protein
VESVHECGDAPCRAGGADDRRRVGPRDPPGVALPCRMCLCLTTPSTHSTPEPRDGPYAHTLSLSHTRRVTRAAAQREAVEAMSVGGPHLIHLGDLEGEVQSRVRRTHVEAHLHAFTLEDRHSGVGVGCQMSAKMTTNLSRPSTHSIQMRRRRRRWRWRWVEMGGLCRPSCSRSDKSDNVTECHLE